MRPIHIVPGLRLRFAGQSAAFDEGVEIGLLAANMARGIGEFTTILAPATLEQARALATAMGYRVHIVAMNDGAIDAMFLTGCRRPTLRLIHGDAPARSSASVA